MNQTQLHIKEMLKLLIRGLTLQGGWVGGGGGTGKSHFAPPQHEQVLF